MKNCILLFFVFTLFAWPAIAQEQVDHEKLYHNLLHHRLGAGVGYTYVPKGEETPNNDDKGIMVPTVAIDYFYKFSHTWSAGLMVDLELKEYVIPVNEEFVTRKNALIIGAVAVYEPIENWGILAGVGIEIEEHHNYGVLRAGTDYAFQIGNHWAISPSLVFDFKEEYSSWALMISAGKHF